MTDIKSLIKPTLTNEEIEAINVHLDNMVADNSQKDTVIARLKQERQEALDALKQPKEPQKISFDFLERLAQ